MSVLLSWSKLVKCHGALELINESRAMQEPL
jgi:hypothetical protein